MQATVLSHLITIRNQTVLPPVLLFLRERRADDDDDDDTVA
jgi:hypothetical protein